MAQHDLLPSEHLVDAERLVAWLNERPRAKTRISRFGALTPVWPFRQQYPTVYETKGPRAQA